MVGLPGSLVLAVSRWGSSGWAASTSSGRPSDSAGTTGCRWRPRRGRRGCGIEFPEIRSVVIRTLVHGEFALGVWAIVGSAIFNLLVIPTVSALVSES